MASRLAGLKGLASITGCDDIRTFQPVLTINNEFLRPSAPHTTLNVELVERLLGKSLNEKDPGVLAYMCTTKTRVFIIRQDQIKDRSYDEQLGLSVKNFDGRNEQKTYVKQANVDRDVHSAEMSSASSTGRIVSLDEIEENGIVKSGNQIRESLIFQGRLDDIEKILLHPLLPDRFGILMKRSYKDSPCGFVSMSSCHRKMIVEELQISRDTAMMYIHNCLQNLPVEFLPSTSKIAKIQFRHPSIMMYNALPRSLKLDQKTFYRCGYIFLGPEEMKDFSLESTYSTKNRHVSTYYWDSVDDSGKPMNIEDSKHLIFRIMPERRITKNSHHSNLHFHLWVESIAWFMADADNRSRKTGNFFVPERGIYRKKLNVVKDEAMWHCFRMHIFTNDREIGIIGVRRKFIPPQINTFQDMVFVLKGIKQISDHRTNEPKFMDCVERIVDTLSPTVMDWKWNSKWITDLDRKKEVKQNSKLAHVPHPTYIDRFMIQIQVNALLCSTEVYSWLRNRPMYQIKPTQRFGGQTLYFLAEQFCISILRTTGLDMKSILKDSDLIPVVVKDPLSIIKRIETTAGKMLKSDFPVDTKKKLLNRWRWRVSAYFAHAVDSFMPEYLNIQSLAMTVKSGRSGMNQTERDVLNQVIAFLVFLHKDGVPFDPTKSIYAILQEPQQLKYLQCNEFVLSKLLETGYFSDLFSRCGDERMFSKFLGNLILHKSHNLELLRVICKKALRQVKTGFDRLLEPLIQLACHGNIYAKNYSLQALQKIATEKGALSSKIHDLGCSKICLDIIHHCPSRDLILSAVTLLRSLIEKDTRILFGPVSYRATLDRLLYLLGKQQMGQRHDASVLASISTLVMKICAKAAAGTIYYLVVSGVVSKLMAIIEDDRNYFAILVPVTATLGTIFFQTTLYASHFPALILEPTSEFNENLSTQAEILVSTLKTCTTKEGLQIALNILIVLIHVLNVEAIESMESVAAKRDRKERNNSAIKLRREISLNLVENHGLEHALTQAKTTASSVERQINARTDFPNEKKETWKTITTGVKSKAEQCLDIIKGRGYT